MLFNSFHFLFFFPVVFFAFYLVPRHWRTGLLLVASCYFYMAWIPAYILILFAIILLDFFTAFWIERSQGAARRLALAISLTSNIAILGVFKYYNFFAENIAGLLHGFGYAYEPWVFTWLLPIGLSFHTFQSMSYTIEVYRGAYPAERRLDRYALYVLIFPQMVAGPIERPQNVLPQLHRINAIELEPANVWTGLQWIAIGLIRKVVVADNLALIVDRAFQLDARSTAPMAIFGIWMFALQIYCDFCGYSEIARGSARMLGLNLMVNFDQPYISQSLSEFWRRWHISLSTWFRDYVYISLGGNRVSPIRRYLNLFVVFLLSGFWHGANWTFLAWGAFHGIGLGIERAVRSVTGWKIGTQAGWRGWLKAIVVFQIACVGWVFFRAPTWTVAVEYLRQIFFGWSGAHWRDVCELGGGCFGTFAIASSCFLIPLLEIAGRRAERPLAQSAWRPRVALAVSVATYWFWLLTAYFGERPFLYFQF